MAGSQPFYQAFVEVTPTAKGFNKKLADEFAGAGDEGGRRAGAGMQSGILGSVGRLAAPLAAAFAGLGIGKLFADSITNASDLNEAGTAVAEIFGPANDQIQAFAAKGATAFGQTSLEVLNAAKTFGVYGQAAGLAAGENAKFSQDLVGLSTDLASFFNTDPSQAVEAIAAGLRGESEPLRQFGVLLDDATLKARAMELGIYSGTGSLTQQQRVLAAQAEILAQTGTAQGDFARTSDGLANQQRILSAGLTNLSASFGQIFLPVAETVVGFLASSVVPGLQSVIDVTKGAVAILFQGDYQGGLFEQFGIAEDSPIVDFLFSIREGAQELFAAIGPLLPQFLELWSSISPVSIIFQAIQPLLPQIVSVLTELATTVGGALGEAFTVLGPVLGDVAGILVGVLGQALSALLPVVLEVVQLVGPLFSSVLGALTPLLVQVATIFGQLLEAVMPLLTPILGLIEPLASLVASILPPLVELFAALLTPILDLISPLLDLLVPVLEVIIGVLSTLIGWVVDAITWFVGLVTGSEEVQDGIRSAWQGVLDFFDGLWSSIGEFFSNGIDSIISWFTSLPQTILNALAGAGTWLVDVGRDMIQGLLDGAGKLLRGIGNFFLSVLPGWIVDPFKAALGIHSPSRVFREFGADTMSGYLLGVDDMQSEVNAGLASAVQVPNIGAHLDAAVASSSVSVSSAGGGDINFNGDVYTYDPEELADEIQKKKRRANAVAGLGQVVA